MHGLFKNSFKGVKKVLDHVQTNKTLFVMIDFHLKHVVIYSVH